MRCFYQRYWATFSNKVVDLIHGVFNCSSSVCDINTLIENKGG